MSRINVAGLIMATIGCGGCAAGGNPAFGPQGAAGAVAPGGALGAPSSPCHVAGPSQIVASKVFVPAGVEATLEGGQMTVRFAHRKSRCVASRVLDGSGEPLAAESPAECPSKAPDVVATSEGETIIAREAAWGDARQPHVELGVVVYDAPRRFLGFSAEAPRQLVERIFEAPRETRFGGESSPGLAPIAGERFLLTWVDENPDGHGLHAQAVAGWGEAVGPALDLSPVDVSVIGRASAVVGPDGRGVVAFLASSEGRFDVRATPIACESR